MVADSLFAFTPCQHVCYNRPKIRISVVELYRLKYELSLILMCGAVIRQFLSQVLRLFAVAAITKRNKQGAIARKYDA